MKRTLFALIALAALGAHTANAQVRVSVSVARPGIRIVGEFREAPRPVPVERYCEWDGPTRYCWDARPYYGAPRPVVVYVRGGRPRHVNYNKHAHARVVRWMKRYPPPHRYWVAGAPPRVAVRVVYVR
jgi:hypothetical protein